MTNVEKQGITISIVCSSVSKWCHQQHEDEGCYWESGGRCSQGGNWQLGTLWWHHRLLFWHNLIQHRHQQRGLYSTPTTSQQTATLVILSPSHPWTYPKSCFPIPLWKNQGAGWGPMQDSKIFLVIPLWPSLPSNFCLLRLCCGSPSCVPWWTTSSWEHGTYHKRRLQKIPWAGESVSWWICREEEILHLPAITTWSRQPCLLEVNMPLHRQILPAATLD